MKAGTDFNDLHQAEGIERVRECILAAAEPATDAPNGPTANADTFAHVELRRGDSIKPEAVSWLWDGYLVGGKVNIFAGAPGTGKTTLALALAATVTIGGRWPDGTKAAHGDVLIWSGEDGVSDTLIPRLLACGADMRRVLFVDRVFENKDRRPFDPAKDLAMLRRAMLDSGRTWKLLIVDSIVSATSGDSHKNAEVRKGLEPLGALADETGCAILGITHFTKGTSGREPLERVTGSLAFGAYARIVLATAKRDQEHGGGRIVTRAKSNLGPDGGGFVYDIEQTELPGHAGIFASRVLWGEGIEGTARDILADAEAQPDDGEGGARKEVESWLADLMLEEGGKVDRRDVMRAAQAMGFKERTVHRARESLGLVVAQSGFGKDKRSVWMRANPAIPANDANACHTKGLANMGTHGTNGAESTSETEGVL